LITSIQVEGTKRIVSGVSHDNGEIATVVVNGQPAKITFQQAGVAEWTITLETSVDGHYIAKSTDRAGNVELTPHDIRDRMAH